MSDRRRTLIRSFTIGVVLALGVFALRAGGARAQEPAPGPTAAPAEAAPAAPQPKGPDPTGAVTGTAADVPVKDAANPTLSEVMETVGHNKISINIVWTLLTG